MNDRDRAIIWARNILTKNIVALDTETTGLDDLAEACQIGIVDKNETVLLDTLIRTTHPIPAEATRIHGITNIMLGDAQPPSIKAIYKQLDCLAEADAVLIYNAEFDCRILRQSFEAVGMKDPLFWLPSVAVDVMSQFARFYGQWDDVYGNYRWQKLTTAAKHFNINTYGAHSAATDALMTLKVVKAMAASTMEREAIIDGQQTKEERP